MADKIRLDTKYDLNGEYNPSDSEDEYSEEEKRLLTKARKGNQEDSGSEEEVYGFSDSEKDDIADSDIEGQGDFGTELPDSRAWGKKKKSFYSTDYVDEDYGGFGKEEEAATLEEKEARVLQNKLAEQLEDDDFSLEFFTSKKDTESKKEKDGDILIKTDLSQLSKRQKLQLLEKESPELSGLVDDFQTKMSLAKNTLLPFLNLVKEREIPFCKAIQFVQTEYELILNYCTNISFYLLLKVKKKSIQNHPATKRLYQYRQMLNQMEPIYESTIRPQIEAILSAAENNGNINVATENKSSKKSKSVKKLNIVGQIDKKVQNGLLRDSDNSDSNEDDEKSDDALDAEAQHLDESAVTNNAPEEIIADGDGGEKRAITYQMAKNKGLTPHRKKEQRNPRVKHRNKYRKAKVRRKGAVREVRTELNRYAGEISGIKSNVKKSIKIR